MRISGYPEVALPSEQIVTKVLAEISISATPTEARRMAAFLLAAADEMDRMGAEYSHLHLSDKQPGFDTSPHVTIFNAEHWPSE
ncbi:Imm32 family immunity protein [Lysobacter panacisoli]|nr:hypothetical protein [Lysobacter panacisoli]